MEVKIEERPGLRVVGFAHKGPYPEIGAVFEKTFATAGKLGLLGPESLGVALYYDNPLRVAPEKLRSFAGVTVGPDVEPAEGMEIREVRPGRVAVTVHEGHYEGLPDAWLGFMQEAFEKKGLTMAEEGPCYERYLNDCTTTPPEDLRTEICSLLAE